MLREIQLQLNLLAACDPSLKTVGPVDDPLDQPLVAMVKRQLELPVDDEMRKIGAEPHFRHGVDQAQRGVKVVGDAVAVGLELDRHADLV